MIRREAKKLRRMLRSTESKRWRMAERLQLNRLEDDDSAA